MERELLSTDPVRGNGTVLGLKIAAIFFIFCTTMLGTLPPLYLRKNHHDHTRMFSYCSCLSGGIFIGFGFLHIFPDAVEGFDRNVNGFPLPYFLCLCGFFGVLLVERFFFSLLARQQTEMELPKGEEEEGGKRSTEIETSSSDLNAIVKKQPPSGGHSHENEFHTHSIPISKHSPYMCYMLTIGLSFHSVFEGLALALQNDLVSLIVIFIGIAVHKPAEAFAMGVNFLRSEVPKSKWLALTATFSAVTPFGIALGLILITTLNGETLALTASILQAVAVGAFLYVGILGVVVIEFSSLENTPQKIFLFLFGIVCMGLLGVLESAEKGDS